MQIVNSQISIEKTNHSRIKEQDINNSPFGKVFSDHMLVATYANDSWQEVKIIPYGNIPICPSLSVLHYGQAVFEGLKAYKSPMGKPLLFRLEANYKRINESAFRLCMPSIPEEIFVDGLKELIRLDVDWIPNQSDSTLYIRPIYFATDESIALRPANSYKFIVICCPTGTFYSAPVKLIATDKYVRACEGGTGATKCAGNYGGSFLADKEAKQQSYDNVLWLDGKEKKYIEECGTMNVAFVINDVVITPKLTGSILGGITRDSVLTLFRDMGVKVEERLISIDEVVKAYEMGNLSEAFGMGTAATIAHISTINYQGKDMILPTVDERKYASQVLQKLEDIKTGKITDPYGWVSQL